ncbi:MAG: alpha/beta hydrolase [Acidimicrobiales bacterium]|nr:alpha/beta hydrolase [Acidimicrobiales bacterium]
MRIKVRDTELYFDVEGAGLVPDGPAMREKPTLLLLHGGPGFDHSGFKPGFSELTDVAQIIYLDHRGQGRSDRADPSTWNLADWGDDVRAFCEVLGIEKPIVLGQSFGGFVAMSYATRHPDHPAKLILSSTSAKMRIDRILAEFERLGGTEAREVAEAFWTGDDQPAALGPYMEICMPLYGQVAPHPDANARVAFNLDVLFAFDPSDSMDFRADLARVQCPTLVMAGTEDPITPVACHHDILAALPDHIGTLEVFDGCGHGVFRDDPARGYGSIRNFITASA